MSTAPPQQVLDWLNRKYPKPRVDPQWLDECYGWLVNDQGLSATGARLQELLDALESQLLQSSLQDSMLPGTGLPTRISLSSNPPTKLTGPPVLVEITSITEIASSAHSLNQTRIARMERMSNGATEEGDGDEEVEGEGPIPKYSRGMLRLELSDGTTTLKAIEYRSIPELTLGITPLGYKVRVGNPT
ncbi:hypothetical protein BD779DRAFT_1608647 [Infundibulicybe gibba]|nr:hypothetical protein BD779DRAFT_1608647 [Infundibulicybe gibba]